MQAVRIDKWLWAARFFKTRAVASEAVSGGRVHVNGARVKPSKEIRPTDRVEIRIGEVQWTVVVASLSDKRGPSSIAGTLYDETPASLASRSRQAEERRLSPLPAADQGARPSKQFRRRMDAVYRRSERERGRNRT